MKKRMKIVATLACLCMALAVMAYGVYAAGSVTYTLNNTVSYIINDVLVKVTRQIDYLPTSQLDVPTTAANVETAISGKTWTTGTAVSFQTYDDTTKVWKDPTAGTGQSWTDGTSTMSDAIACNFNSGYVYRITIRISSIAAAGITVSYAIPASSQSNTFIKAATSGNIVTGSTVTTESSIVYYLGLLDQTTAIGTNVNAGSFTITLAKI